MLTKLICRNFKNFDDVEVELGNPVVFIGPNNSGKTTALQALALWQEGLKRWNENRKGKTDPEKRPGVAINRLYLTSVLVPRSRLLWHNLKVRDAKIVDGKQQTKNIRIDITVEGVTKGKNWECGLEFDYTNSESIYCRPLRILDKDGEMSGRMRIPDEARNLPVAFLHPMSGIVSNERSLDKGAINVSIGEGRTAEVLRNLCYQVAKDTESWDKLCDQIKTMFKVDLDVPNYIQERGEIAMEYRDESGVQLDLSSSGRGLQQTLLLLSYIAINPGCVLLLDEPDAHLEIIRQREIYQVLTESATEYGSQIIAASHSEVILNEAAERDVVIVFLGKPHRINDRSSQLLKSLRTIGFEHYHQAEQKGWVLYLEGATDFAILRDFAKKLNHEVHVELEKAYVHYVGNQPNEARKHFYGLREAYPDLVGFSLFDRISKDLQTRSALELIEYAWKRREIENYIVFDKQVLIDWARDEAAEHVGGPLFSANLMEENITEIEKARETLGQESAWSSGTKISTEFLDPLFTSFFKKLELPNLMRKTNYHTLVKYVLADQIAPEVTEVLDRILDVANKAVPL